MRLSGSSVPRLIKSLGSEYTLAKIAEAAGPNEWTKGAETRVYYPMHGHQGRLSQRDIVGDIKQGDIKIVCSPSVAVPERGDLLAIGRYSALTHGQALWMRVIDVDPKYQASKVVMIRLFLRR